MKSLVALALSFVGLGAVPFGQTSFGFAPGDRLLDLELPTIDGERTIRLSALRGRKLLLIQFASW